MATVLTDSTAITPVFPTQQNEASSNNGESLLSVEKMLIETIKHITKEGNKLTIDGELFNIENYNLIDFCSLLKQKKINVAFINNNDYWYYPALCIKDFSNIEQHQTRITSNPFDLVSLQEPTNLSIEPYSKALIQILTISSQSLRKYQFTIKDNLVFVNDFKRDCYCTYQLKITKFSIKLDKKFSSSSKEVVSRYLDTTNDFN